MKADAIALLLPDVFRRAVPQDPVLAGLLEVMEAHHAPVEELLANLDAIFDPRRTPDALVPVLARWVDLERIYALDGQVSRMQDDIALARLRELVANSHTLSQLRGTEAGLIAFLETATGVGGFTIEVASADGPQAAFHLLIRVPPAAAAQRSLIERIVASEKPAYATSEIV